MLITFEGLDCGGKSSIVREVAVRLRARLSAPVMQLPDVSQAPTGRRLSEVYQTEELFGKGIADSIVISRCMAAAADLFYFDAALIAPMVAARGVVLKERHIDTLIAHEGPILTGRLGWTEQRAYDWLSTLFEPLQVRPALTFLVDAPLDDRERRLEERLKMGGGTLSPGEAEVNRAAFRIRGEWYERMRERDGGRWVSIDNPDGELQRSVDRAIAAILDRRSNSAGRRFR